MGFEPPLSLLSTILLLLLFFTPAPSSFDELESVEEAFDFANGEVVEVAGAVVVDADAFGDGAPDAAVVVVVEVLTGEALALAADEPDGTKGTEAGFRLDLIGLGVAVAVVAPC